MELTMKTKSLLASALLFALLLSVRAFAWGATAPTVTQTVTLNPGWNAVYLEVEPLAKSPAVVFKALPGGSSVWAWTGKDDSVQFIQDPSEAPVNSPKWLAIFTSAAESFLTNLYAITANSPYLIHVAGTSSRTITVEGRPTIRHKGWVPDSFNLTGFSFASTPPTFATFFAPSNSHKNQAIYRLNNTTGAWEMVNNPATTAMRSGEAFWIYCQSGSDYQGPFTVETAGADGLDFGEGVTLLKLTINNHSPDSDRSITVTQLPSPNPVALACRSYDATSGSMLTTPLASMGPVAVKKGGASSITLAVLRGNFSAEASSVLEFADGLGNRVRVPVTAVSNASTSYPGLWAGVATLNRVSQVSEITGTAPDFAAGEAKPTPAELNLNLILHQDSGGQVRLLKQVVMMYREATLNPDGTTAAPGRSVALTQDSLIPNFSGVTQRDGSKVGRRISAAGFDYSASANTDFNDTALKCQGTIPGTVTCNLLLDSSSAGTAPTNPFLHRYHPDHDNLAADYLTFKQEANRIQRDITIVFEATPRVNPDNPPPGWGVSLLGGTYTEHIKGLAKGPIKVEGDFTLTLVTDVNVLNQ
jgi:hypothetical protein